MNRSDIHLLNLPDEIILIILKKLNNIDVLYSLVDIKNNRLDVLAQDKYFTNTLNLVLSDQMIFDRFCIYILPRIHGNIKYLILESLALKSILLAGSYPNLKNLKLFKFGQDIALQFFKDDSPFERIFKQQITDLTLIYNDNDGIVSLLKDYTINIYAHILNFFKNLQNLTINGSSIAAYPGLSLCDLPSTTFSSSILTKLCINISTFDDCLYLLDGRLNQLNTLIIRIYDIGAPSLIVHNQDNLFNLKCFSLTCHSHISSYDNQVLPLLRRMINLHELTLCLTVLNRTRLIDGIHLQNEILISMPLLNNFIFDIRSWTIVNGLVEPLTNDDIHRTFTDIKYQQIDCSIRYFLGNNILCHVFTLPFPFDYLQCITNNFPNIIFNNVLYLSICDILPFEHEFFIRISQAFPLLKHLTVSNSTPQTWTLQQQNDNNQSYSIVKYPYLTYLSVMNSDVTYTEEFLLETKTYLPCLNELRVNYEKLKTVTENFTRNATRFNCNRVKSLITEVTFIYSNDFSLYFPLL